MSESLIDGMDTVWSSLKRTLFEAVSATDSAIYGAGRCNQLVARPGSQGATVVVEPSPPINLSQFDELRFWIKASVRADGSDIFPYFLEFSYTDINDDPLEEHRWFVPVNISGRWEQRRIGIENERRSAIVSMMFRSLSAQAFVCYIDDILAIREEMFSDIERSLVRQVLEGIRLPGVTGVPLVDDVNPGDTQLVVQLNRGFSANNNIELSTPRTSPEIHRVSNVLHDIPKGITTLSFDVSDPVLLFRPKTTATVSVQVPVTVEAPPAPRPDIAPSVVLTQLDIREDLERTYATSQRDSFRVLKTKSFCSTRPFPKAYALVYQIMAVSSNRQHQLAIETAILQRLAMPVPLVVYGQPVPISTIPPPVPTESKLGMMSPIVVRLCTTMEIAPRQQIPVPQRVEVHAGYMGTPLDKERVY